MQHLQRDVTVVAQVVGEKDRREAAAPELALDAILTAEYAGEDLTDGQRLPPGIQ
jgi:hypothetical protein